MQSQSFLRKSHLLLLKQSPAVHTFKPFSSCTLRHQHLRSIQNNFITKRFISTGNPPPTELEERSTTSPTRETSALGGSKDVLEPCANIEEPDKLPPKNRRTRITPLTSAVKDAELPEFPEGLADGILYLPTETFLDSEQNSGLPPSDIFEEALDNLLITLHPQNQRLSLPVTGGTNRPIEPTLGLYCPIEGGDYVVDLTVHELAYQTGAEVLVLDAVQLAAGEWGPFGKGIALLIVKVEHFSSRLQNISCNFPEFT
jgi:hypothetical protein